MPAGPADIMAGGSGGEAPEGGGAPAGGAPQRMPPQIMQMVQDYKAALAKNPNDLEALIGLANLEFDSGQWEKAIEYYSRALTIDSKNADVRVDRAIAYHATGRNDLAKKELLLVTRERPTLKNAWLNLGVVNRDLGDRAWSFINEHWTNFWPPRYLTVRRRTGFLRNFVINPDDRAAFLADLKARIGKAAR